eukprot:TRINITY_DN1532_c0_g1_i12.p1 TRINITY_DN1532_c0_g1~~TRINITY_DN1532_c0_g1_i12.p1  ORF type:complete len:169 (-),score=10.37 TRINITY_DN1532_c0_g1_i12:32-538(-)
MESEKSIERNRPCDRMDEEGAEESWRANIDWGVDEEDSDADREDEEGDTDGEFEDDIGEGFDDAEEDIRADLTLQWQGRLAATDASSSGGGMAYLPAHPEEAAAWSTLGPEGWTPERREWTCAQAWRVAHAYRWDWSAHINVLEASAAVTWAVGGSHRHARWPPCTHA